MTNALIRWTRIKQNYDEIDSLPLTDSAKTELFQTVTAIAREAETVLRIMQREAEIVLRIPEKGDRI